ncbi:hypothetical protein D3C84_742690 [compost metagenome]
MLRFLNRFDRGQRTRRHPLHGRDKAITALGNVDDVALPVLPVAQCATQRGDMHAQVDLLDHRSRPDECDELVLADHVARTLDQHLQDIQGPPAHAQRPVPIEDQPLPQVKRIRAESQHRFVVQITDAVHAGPRAQTLSGSTDCHFHCAPGSRLHYKEFTGIFAGLGDGTTVTVGASRPSRCAERTKRL